MPYFNRAWILSSFVVVFSLLAAAAQQGAQDATPQGAAPAASSEAVAAGKTVFEDKCSTCHSADTDEMLVGPGLKELFKWPPHKMSDGTEHKEHTVEMIRQQITEGGGGMPPVDVAGPDLDNLMAYLQTL
jgi:mono/diheme cytochrome c family protein